MNILGTIGKILPSLLNAADAFLNKPKKARSAADLEAETKRRREAVDREMEGK